MSGYQDYCLQLVIDELGIKSEIDIDRPSFREIFGTTFLFRGVYNLTYEKVAVFEFTKQELGHSGFYVFLDNEYNLQLQTPVLVSKDMGELLYPLDLENISDEYIFGTNTYISKLTRFYKFIQSHINDEVLDYIESKMLFAPVHSDEDEQEIYEYLMNLKLDATLQRLNLDRAKENQRESQSYEDYDNWRLNRIADEILGCDNLFYS